MRLSRLIGNILGFSKDQPLAGQAVPSAGGHRWKRASRNAPEFPGVEWTIGVPADLSLCRGIEDVFRQVAENLARNAANAMGGKGAYRGTGSRAGAGGRFCSRIRARDCPRRCGRGCSSLSSPDRRPGTGLGLSIVKSLCERSGWTIALARRRGRGRQAHLFRGRRMTAGQ